MKNVVPIKRSKSLVALSKEHHDGLLLSWKTRQGLRKEVAPSRISNYIVEVFNKELQHHFITEETLIFSCLSATDELRIKAEQDHAAIREMIAGFSTFVEPHPSTLSAFATLLDGHIRFEERTLFPYIEKNLSTETLEGIGAKLEEEHNQRECVVWLDEFWVMRK